MCQSRLRFKSVLKHCQRNEDSLRDNALSKSYMQKDSYSFWKDIKGTDHVGTFMGLKCVVYYANYRSGNQSSKIQVVP